MDEETVIQSHLNDYEFHKLSPHEVCDYIL